MACCYAVFVGRKPGVYLSWQECQKQVSGYPGACYQKYPFLCSNKPMKKVDVVGKIEWKDVVLMIQFLTILVLCYKLMYTVVVCDLI